jgi:hypothetical protein
MTFEDVRIMTPPTQGFIFAKLGKDMVDHLWKMIKRAEKDQERYKHRLAGNITQSFGLDDDGDYVYREACLPLIEAYRNSNGGSDPVRNFVQMHKGAPLLLTEFWVNYQHQTDFNPFHFHGGVYSFAVWMKQPTSWEEQCKLPQFQEIKKDNRKAGTFEFQYTDSLGGIRSMSYQLSPEFENCMVFFPASLMHSVYPFYGTDEPRISVAGNLWYDTTGKGRYGNALDPSNLGDQTEYLKQMEGQNQFEDWDKTKQQSPQNDTFKVNPRKPRKSKKSKGFKEFIPEVKE